MTKETTIDLLIIIPPLGVKNTVYPPYGSMYIASALRQGGYKVKILDVDAERIANKEVVKEIKYINPRYIGFSGIIATSYKYIKNLGHELKLVFPEKIQILGGGLSSAAPIVLKNTSIDIVVCGEGDITIVELMDCLQKEGDLNNVAGIYYKNGSSFINTGRRPLIANLDTLPYPAFDLIDMNKYLPDGEELIHVFLRKINDKRKFAKKKGKKTMTIPTSRGCFNECSFCFRAYPGLRLHSIKYVFDFVEYCIKKFGVSFFTFGDECFAPNKKRNWEFIEEYKKRNLDIVFRILGMRVDTIDQDILRAYKEIGCWMIGYGFESGSQKMLNIINKKVTVEQNRNAAQWTNQSGIYTSAAIILGMPGETSKTVQESIIFLESLNLDFKQYQWKYAIPIPGSQLYEFAKLSGAIEDEDKYLSSLSGEFGDGNFNINLTDEPDEVVAGWAQTLKQALDRHYLYKKYKIKNSLILKLINLFLILELNFRRKKLALTFRKKLKNIFGSILRVNNKDGLQKNVQFRKKINIKNLINDTDPCFINSCLSLREINECLKNIEKDQSKVSC